MGRCSQCNTEYAGGERFCPLDGGAVIDLEHAGDPMIGRRVADRYLVKRRLGQGGMGEVYLADHVGLDKEVALKFILEKYTEDSDVLTRFHREARTASRIGHENIVDITDVGQTEDGRHYIVMEYLRGADLGQVLRRSGAMPIGRAVSIVKQVLGGLAAAHEKGVIHRDMKPENVFLTERAGTADFVKIMDFGISKFIAAHDSKVRLTQTGAVIGTPIYMAPEQAQAADAIDHRADVYAVGVMLFEMLCGRPPFTATSYLALVTQHLHEEPPAPRSLRADVPPAIERAVLRALAKRPEERFASALELARALERAGEAGASVSADRFAPTLPRAGSALSGEPPPARAAATAAGDDPAGGRRRKAALVAAALTALGAAALGVFLWSGDRRAGEPQATAVPALADAGRRPVGATDAARAPVVQPIEAAILEVDSSPRGARIYLDGELRGETPLSLGSVEPGDYALRLELEGYKPLEARKTVRGGYRESFFGTLAESGSARPGRVKKSGGRPARPAGGKESEKKGGEKKGGEKKGGGKKGGGKKGGGEEDQGKRPDPKASGGKSKPNPYLD